jgi:hypothetical protein
MLRRIAWQFPRHPEVLADEVGEPRRTRAPAPRPASFEARCARTSGRRETSASALIPAMHLHPSCCSRCNKRCLKRTGGISFLPPFKRREAERRTAHLRYPHLKETRARPYADRSPFGAPPRLCAGIVHPNSAWAALPGIAGCKREDPLRRQCSRHPAVRSRAGRDDAQTACRSVGVTGRCPSRRAR